MPMRTRIYAAPPIAVLTLFLVPAAMAAPMKCEGLTPQALGVNSVTIQSATPTPVGEKSPAASCVIRGATGERQGGDGQPYAINFELRLPDNWNGGFVHQLNGGNDGEVVPAVGPLLGGNVKDTALGRGYAVISSDAGHSGAAVKDAGLAGGARFGFDAGARSDYGYRAAQVLTPLAKQMISAYYGNQIAHSYAVGCSNGGRHGMVAAARLPGEFDGILVGAPGFNLPKAGIQHALDVQQFHAVTGDLKTAFSREDLGFLSSRIVEACDSLDGVADGSINDTKACQATFNVDKLVCGEGQNSACLSAKQVSALKAVHAGPHNSKGEQLYSDWAWDAGIGSNDWRFWKLESPIPPWEQKPLIAVMGSSSVAQIFTTPPTKVGGSPTELEQFLLSFDLDKDAPKIYAKSAEFSESAMDFMTPPGADNPDLATFRDAGAKLMIFHGVSDPVFSFMDTAHWYDKLDTNNGGKAKEFARLFPVPGMPHCSGGPSTDNFDMFSKLVEWAEKGKAPDQVVASVTAGNKELPATWSATRSRPLCPYPMVARYKGGDPESAASFACEP